MIARPERRRSLGASGLQRVGGRFAMAEGIDRLVERFGAPAAAASAAQ